MIREAWGLEVIRQGLVYRCSFAGEGAVERDLMINFYFQFTFRQIWRMS